jgi:hypothetical protein
MMSGMRGIQLLSGVALLCAVALACTVSGPTANSAKGTPPGPCHRIHELGPDYSLGSGERVTFALAGQYGQTSVEITSCIRGPLGYVQEWQAPGFAGSAGFGLPGPVKVNSLKTPSGSFSMSEAFGRRNPGTALPYRQLREDSYWGGSKGTNFNEYFQGAGTWPDEPLWDYMESGIYEQAAVINYNRPPDMEAVHGQTFAIFLHAGLSETWGCISTDLDTVTKFLRTAQPGEHIIMGVESTIFATP